MWDGISCWFALHFPEDYQCWVSFHKPIDHLHVFFGEISIQFFCSFFFNRLCFMLSSMSCFYVLDINPLLVISFANIFFHSVGCLFFLLMVDGLLCCAKTFKLSFICLFCSYFLYFSKLILRMLLWFISKNDLSVFLKEFYSIQSYI